MLININNSEQMFILIVIYLNVYGEIYMLGKIGENTIKIIVFPENLRVGVFLLMNILLLKDIIN